MMNVRRGVLICLLIVASAGCDRVTKHYAMSALSDAPPNSYLSDTVRVQYVENPGAFLGVGSTWHPSTRAILFQLCNGLFLIAAALLATRLRFSRIAMVGLVLFLAGAASNLIDRMVLGTVVDFLNVGIGPIRTGVFNVADVAIMVGIAILLLESFRATKDAKTHEGREG